MLPSDRVKSGDPCPKCGHRLALFSVFGCPEADDEPYESGKREGCDLSVIGVEVSVHGYGCPKCGNVVGLWLER